MYTEADCDLSVIRNLAREFEEPTHIKVPPVVRGVPFEGDSDDCKIIGRPNNCRYKNT